MKFLKSTPSLQSCKNTQKLLAFTMVASLLTSCSSTPEATSQTSTANSGSSTGSSTTSTTSTEKLKIMTTTFPEYDWVREILGDNIENVELTQLMDNGVDLHSYAPTTDDIIAIGSADLFIYNGGESTDAWVEDVLAQKTNDDMIILNMLETLGDAALESEHFHYDSVEEDDHDHSEDEHDHDHEEEEHDHSEDDHDHDHEEEEHDHSEDEHDHDHEEEHDHSEDEHDHDHEEEEHDHSEDEHDYEEDEHDHSEDEHDHDHSSHDDEHVWLSLRNAQLLSTVIAEKISEIDPDNKSSYEENLAAYVEKLSDLDKQYDVMVSNAEKNVILVADRFPFVYLATDYDIDYHAAFSGCSAETEASFEIVVALTEKVNELDLSHVLTTETGHEIADTIVSSTNSKDQEILALDSMQSTTSKSGDTYLGIMEDNLEVLTEVLN